MNLRGLLLMAAASVLLIHTLLWHEHTNHGVQLPVIQQQECPALSFLECLLGTDTGEEHLEIFQAGSNHWQIHHNYVQDHGFQLFCHDLTNVFDVNSQSEIDHYWRSYYPISDQYAHPGTPGRAPPIMHS